MSLGGGNTLQEVRERDQVLRRSFFLRLQGRQTDGASEEDKHCRELNSPHGVTPLLWGGSLNPTKAKYFSLRNLSIAEDRRAA
jgi:hypothetical protein